MFWGSKNSTVLPERLLDVTGSLKFKMAAVNLEYIHISTSKRDNDANSVPFYVSKYQKFDDIVPNSVRGNRKQKTQDGGLETGSS
jgi:hypothetical protein